MSPELVGAVAVGVMLLLLFLGIPIAICLILVGSVGFAIIVGYHQALNMVALSASSTLSSYTFAVLPVFLIMGELGDISGMMNEAYDATNTWLRKIPGGLAMASVVGASLFSCVSGSSIACAAVMTKVAIPNLLKHRYDPTLATGAVAAGGTLGNIVPPGVILVIYAIMTEVSLGKFFVACYLPGFLLTFMYMVQIYIQCKLNPSLGPATASSTTWKEKLFAIKGIVPVVIVLIAFLGGIQFGVFTPNEGASVSTVFVFLYALIRKTLNGQNLLQAFKSTLVTTGMTLAILVGADIFNVLMAVSGLAQALAVWVTGLHLSALGVVILIMVIYFILGVPMDPLAILVLTIPIFLPVLKAYHIDLYWFGVLAILQVELANITPPVGMYLFVVAQMVKARGISMETVFRGSYSFCATCIACLVLLIAFPQISTFMVSLMK
jgi:tripartite ATP-independent transporter DctM subunit